VRADRTAGRHELENPSLLELEREHLAGRQLVGPNVDRTQVDERPVEVEEDRLLSQTASLRLGF
jgi:hypothetical protein